MKTQQRRAIVGVIGGEGEFETSAALGRSITRHGWILLTGGQLVPRALAQKKAEVKESAMLGAAEEESGHPRLVGILPSSSIRWDYTAVSRRLFLHTGQPHYVRNVINGRTPDAVVVFGGSRGTLAEIAFAKASGKPLFFAKDSINLLRHKLDEHFGDSRVREINLRTYFEEPLKVYPAAAGAAGDTLGLFWTLEPTLARAAEETDVATALQAVFDGLNIAEKSTGFPGLPGNDESRRRFETIVLEISQ